MQPALGDQGDLIEVAPRPAEPSATRAIRASSARLAAAAGKSISSLPADRTTVPVAMSISAAARTPSTALTWSSDPASRTRSPFHHISAGHRRRQPFTEPGDGQKLIHPGLSHKIRSPPRV